MNNEVETFKTKAKHTILTKRKGLTLLLFLINSPYN